MRWLRYSLAGATHYGIVNDNQTITKVNGDPFKGHEKTSTVLAMGDVQLLPPVIPGTFYSVGMNYTKHISAVGARVPQKPDVGYRANNALIAHKQDVVMPADASKVHYEGELVVVIGKTARHISIEQVKDCILGYTIGNDVSERNWQASDLTLWRAKNTDTFKPMGPWIDTDVDLEAMETIITVNGRESSRFRTNDMLFGVERFISEMSRYLTLHPGDVLWMGTDGKSPDLQDGDVVDVCLTGLGTLSNRFVREQ
jgi:2-keto-4-pentenoate hydratase/2-oxohepta-3-ene-1,7-dioic acid hydratase in catechol pathway